MIPVFAVKRDASSYAGKIMRSVLDFIYPQRCLLCDTPLAGVHMALCTGCTAEIPLNRHACQRCALPLEGDAKQGLCAGCLKQAPLFLQTWSPFVYAQPLEWMIRQFKFNAKLSFGPLLSELMLQHLPEQLVSVDKPDVIIPMPLHRKREQQRGFNQSELLARPLARRLGILLDTRCCTRQRHTEHQTGKSAQQRRQNIRGAFSFSDAAYRHVVIFDDVMTTGASVSELSRTLLKAGVERVDVWSLARAEKALNI